MLYNANSTKNKKKNKQEDVQKYMQTKTMRTKALDSGTRKSFK